MFGLRLFTPLAPSAMGPAPLSAFMFGVGLIMDGLAAGVAVIAGFCRFLLYWH